MAGSNDTKEEHGSTEPRQHQEERSERGNSGHGAASALARLITQGREHRHQTGQADDAAGGQGQ